MSLLLDTLHQCSARGVISLFLEISTKSGFILAMASGEEGEGNQCCRRILSSYNCTSGILISSCLARELEILLDFCMAKLLKFDMKGSMAF